jgi:hypothetical protein
LTARAVRQRRGFRPGLEWRVDLLLDVGDLLLRARHPGGVAREFLLGRLQALFQGLIVGKDLDVCPPGSDCLWNLP